MQRIKFPERSTWPDLLKRPTPDFSELNPLVSEVFQKIRLEGDTAVKAYTEKFDGVRLESLEVDATSLENAEAMLTTDLKESIQLAVRNISTFHESQLIKEETIETMPGVRCWSTYKAIEKVGLYIPGGTAPLFSTVIMLAIPAKLAGCKEILLCSPPDKGGNIHPAILYTAQLCGVRKIFKVGGIQAIAAMTFGTESIPGVYKIFGPGNQFVTVAKQKSIEYGLAIDMPAGPSELLVIADHTAIPEFVASDLLSQAEHGKDSQVLLVSTKQDVLERIDLALRTQVEALERKAIAKEALKHSKSILLNSKEDVLALVNTYAPEHLIICDTDEDYYLEHIINAGSVFLGNFTPESAGDYASGTNHTLPTNGYARQYSGVNLNSYRKRITYQYINETGIQQLGKAIETMAEAEGLQAHKNAVTLRLQVLQNKQKEE